jgi:two-component system, NtrC family, nitrogen regulation sensor histidine kinase NtrY
MKRVESKRRIYFISALLGFFVLAYLISILFLNPSSVGNTRFVWKLNLWAVVWAMNFIVILVLLFILARDLIKLFFEYHSNRPGSRIKSKLVLTLVIFSLFPALIMLSLAFGLINRNLRLWFSSPAEQLLDSSRLIADRYYQQGERFAISSARGLAQDAALGMPASELERRTLERGFAGVILFAPGGAVTHRSRDWSEPWPEPELVNRVIAGEPYYEVRRNLEPEVVFPGATKVDKGTVGVSVAWPGGATGALFLGFLIPESVGFHELQIADAVTKYQDVKGGIGDFEANYLAILAFSSLSIVFGFVWLGSYIARRLTGPLEALAEGSRELAAGNLDYRVGVKAVDELGILVDSFNGMADEIKESRLELEKANRELQNTNAQLEERRAYIETVLQNIATGVVSIDESDTIRTVNQAAIEMLATTREQLLRRSLREVMEPRLYHDFLRMRKRARLYGTYRSELTFNREGRELRVAATMTANPLPDAAREEYLVVLDDLTELIRTEKFAAWQEVARRLAHEIKNPLTPIQLSAERVKKRFEKMPEEIRRQKEIQDFGQVVSEATRMIVQESEILKSMVQEFSRFARLPICRPREIELHTLIDQAFSRYDGALRSVNVCKQFDPRIGPVRVDPEQMQRVFVNLIDNSLDAMAECTGERSLSVSTRLNESRCTVSIQLADNGTGIEPGDYEHLFLPYFSTKKRGTGLGLAIVRQIITEHNGFIRAEPNVPRGTRIVVELPILE